MKSILSITLVLLSIQLCAQSFGKAHPFFNNVGSPSFLDAGDINGDGLIDIAVGSENTDYLAILLNDGTGNYRASDHKAADYLLDFVLVDLDQDGDLDVAAATNILYGPLVWYENIGGGKFEDKVELYPDVNRARPFSIIDADMDGDSDPDIIISYYQFNGIIVYENEGGGQFGTMTTVGTEFERVTSIEAVDMDDDGDQDILFTAKDEHTVGWYENDGAGGYSQLHILTADLLFASLVRTADLDGDGDLDVVATGSTYNNCIWIENLGDGTFSNPVYIVDGSVSFSLKGTLNLVDIDLDGDVDVLWGKSGTDYLRIFFNDGLANFSEPVTYSDSVANFGDMIFEDMDGDDKRDILVCNPSGSSNAPEIPRFVGIMTQEAGISFSNPKIVGFGTGGPSTFEAADLDGDGDADILVNLNGEGLIVAYENDGIGTFNEFELVITGFDSYCMEVADINGDGLLDILGSSNDEEIFWYPGESAFEFAERIDIYVGEHNSSNHTLIDLDGDNKLDLLFTFSGNAASGVYVMENDGTGLFSAPELIYNTPTNVGEMEIVDLDSDDDLDIVLIAGNSTSEGFGVSWLEQEEGNSWTSHLVEYNEDYHVDLAVYDVNMDGHLDIMTHRIYHESPFSSSRYFGYFPGDSLGFGSSFVNIHVSDFSSRFIEYADLNADGQDEFVSGGLNYGPYWYQRTPLGDYNNFTFGHQLRNPDDLAIADFDGDGDLDILCHDNTIHVEVYYRQLYWIENVGMCNGDINRNATIDVEDFLQLNSLYGQMCDGCPEDLNQDGLVNVLDFIQFNSSFGTQCH